VVKDLKSCNYSAINKRFLLSVGMTHAQRSMKGGRRSRP